jgi:hypothetical protein
LLIILNFSHPERIDLCIYLLNNSQKHLKEAQKIFKDIDSKAFIDAVRSELGIFSNMDAAAFFQRHFEE